MKGAEVFRLHAGMNLIELYNAFTFFLMHFQFAYIGDVRMFYIA